jgi:hypothetical protein
MVYEIASAKSLRIVTAGPGLDGRPEIAKARWPECKNTAPGLYHNKDFVSTN